MKLSISEIWVDGPLETHWDALLRVVGTLQVEVGGRRWYEEEDFCLVELAASLIKWLESLEEAPEDFVYSSLESAEPELLRFHRVGGDEWQLTAPHEMFREERWLSTTELRRAAEGYLAALREALPWRERVLAMLSEGEEHRRVARALA